MQRPRRQSARWPSSSGLRGHARPRAPRAGARAACLRPEEALRAKRARLDCKRPPNPAVALQALIAVRITYITAGAAGTICGNCLRDNALAAALKNVGHDVVLLPAYTPLLTDEEDVSEPRVVLSGVNLYLQSKLKLARSAC